MFTSTLALTASLAIGAFAQNITSAMSSAAVTRSATLSGTGSAQTTIAAIVGEAGELLEGSIIAADACATTMALSCGADSYLCDSISDVVFTVTQGPEIYEMAYETSTAGGRLTVSQSCDLDGPVGSFTRAVCEYSFLVSVAGTQTKESSTTTIFGTQSDFQYAQLPITAGAEKLPSVSAACTATAAAATDTSSGGAAAPTGIRSEIYKVMVPVGAVLAAGAML
ncbi:uncharacterized protein RCC_09134 [Ramularia collo-cygni]|uniref:GPI anchored cell wall protein n=1 Tax=Ramularia collo-cygni TaxID=112498 RepID=A0A2D3V912_9PEZI|nr:uncharacterized protein RCC_09134 [Ramularia collo-cygni]CZT23420.1 uncharacterized protein RCC_09134 [Ramularia collo-cygni]